MKKYYKSGRLASIILVVVAIAFLNSCQNRTQKMESHLKDFIAAYETKAKTLSKEVGIADWTANISGKDGDYKRSEELQNQLVKIYANREDFAKLKKWKESGMVKDTLLRRQLEVLFLSYQGNQVDTVKLAEMIKMQTNVQKKFNTYRAEVNGKKLSDNQVDSILQASTSSGELKDAWLASKKIGETVADDLKALVKKRNEIAKELGYNNYHEMQLKLGEQDPGDVEKIFDELDNLTRDAFSKLKTEMDDYYVKRYKIKKEELMPWHYQNRFFQEGPKIYELDLDKYYKDKDVVKITEAYYKSLGMDISDILGRSDLYEKPGKYQHAQCGDMDREGDVRVMCSAKNNAYWMGTLLHECGHGVYFKYLDMKTPWELRTPAHTFTTEAIAMMFGRLYSNPQFLKDLVGVPEEEAKKVAEDSYKNLRLEQLVFSRWAQVMYRFEKGLYENPDQDLNTLWWTLVEKYQMLKKPEGRNAPDWASKIHIATAPCYYHNYLLGELLASQLYYHITSKVLNSHDFRNTDFYNKPEAGAYLRDKVFAPGAKLFWNDMIEKATGEKLTAKYYAEQFVK